MQHLLFKWTIKRAVDVKIKGSFCIFLYKYQYYVMIKNGTDIGPVIKYF